MWKLCGIYTAHSSDFGIFASLNFLSLDYSFVASGLVAELFGENATPPPLITWKPIEGISPNTEHGLPVEFPANCKNLVRIDQGIFNYYT